MAIEHDAPQPAVAFPLGDGVHVLGHLIARISERARRSEGAWALELDHQPAEDRVRPRPFGDDVLVALVRGQADRRGEPLENRLDPVAEFSFVAVRREGRNRRGELSGVVLHGSLDVLGAQHREEYRESRPHRQR
jgi:hypothetical protein